MNLRFAGAAAAAAVAIVLVEWQPALAGFGEEDPSQVIIDGLSNDAANPPSEGSETVEPAPASEAVASTRPHGALIARHAEAAGVPVDLAKAVVRVESNFNARARGAAGEVGLMQIKPQTARGIGYSGSVEALYDPDTNLRWGMKYLAGAYKLAGGDICGTVMRYQGGHYARRMTGANRTYCSRVRNFMANGTIRSAAL